MEIFRRSLAAFLVLVFVLFSVVTFTFFAFNNTFLKAAFYTDNLSESGYEFVIDQSAKMIYRSDEFISKNFTESDLKREISNVFSKDIFKKMLGDLGKEVEKVKQSPGEPLVISLKIFRESLLTLANNLAFNIFQNIKECKEGESPAQDLNGLPTCILSNTDYQIISKPFTEQFEKSIYSTIPEQMQFDLNSAKSGTNITPGDIIRSVGMLKNWLYGLLLVILGVIALLVYRPFSLIMLYEGIAFFAAGLIGYILSFGLEGLPKLVLTQLELKEQNADALIFMNTIVGFFSTEAQKLALIFIGFGALLIIVQLFLKKNQRYY
ncbi:MAG TPA: hypothetical protein P5229_04245 [Candidatus Gracilibacteria bacterium]|nr:hypothetical protein [Candidatus Gracilibacteria bacterium]